MSTCCTDTLHQIRECELELRGFRRDLEQFIEQHESTALEFANAGVVDVAREKRVVAEVEKAILRRLRVFVGGTLVAEEERARATEWPTMATIAASLSADGS